MEPNLIPNTDNLFKFLCIGGLVLIFSAMLYPMQKKQEIQIQRNIYNKDVEVINYELSQLKGKLRLQSKEQKLAINKLNRLVESRKRELNIGKKKIISNQIQDIKSDFEARKIKLEQKSLELNVKSIIVKYNLEKVNILNRHVEEYTQFTFWFLVVGIPSFVIGIIGWSLLTVKEYKRTR